jgi:DNA-3-methyladenine glycosylase
MKCLDLSTLPREFYLARAADAARLLLGQILVHGERSGRIVETEAYLGINDRAAHASAGRTARTEVLFGPPGRAYVYFIYGMYYCLNVVVEPEGSPGCVLIRSLEPLTGIPKMRAASPRVRDDRLLCSGPGRLTRSMGITRRHYGADFTRGPLFLVQGETLPDCRVGVSSRIGIRHNRDWPLRFYVSGHPSVSHHPDPTCPHPGRPLID